MAVCQKGTMTINAGDQTTIQNYSYNKDLPNQCYTAAAPSDSVFRALCTNSLTYLLTYKHA